MTGSPAAETVVCFDLGGVLVRICRTWPEACARANLPVRNEQTLASAAARASRREVVDRYQQGRMDCAAYFAALSESLVGLYSAAEVEQIHDAWTLEEYSGVAELVSALEARPGVTTACLSNTNHSHWQRLSGADGRAEYPSVLRLKHRLASHELGSTKPDPEIYALAERHFFAGAPAQRGRVIFFDDLIDNVTSARSAGWHAFQVDHTGDTVAQMRGHLRELGVLSV
jgi:HAD superfamily hydrolase (TIGR01509 family)